jgi:hypothetical protein
MAAPFSTVGGYGGNASLVLDTTTGQTAGQVDTQDGFPILMPALNPTGAGGLVPNVVNPIALNPFTSYPEINAIIVELRVLTALVREMMGPSLNQSYDLQQMRADEAWSTNNATGAL